VGQESGNVDGATNVEVAVHHDVRDTGTPMAAKILPSSSQAPWWK
jgi:hypothetical protein